MLMAPDVEGLTLMVSEHGPVTIGRDVSLAFHIVASERVQDDVIHAFLVCKCEFYVNVSAFT